MTVYCVDCKYYRPMSAQAPELAKCARSTVIGGGPAWDLVAPGRGTEMEACAIERTDRREGRCGSAAKYFERAK